MNVLIVEDDAILANNLLTAFKKERIVADISETTESAKIRLEVNEYDCLILDINLPDGNGLQILDKIRKASNDIPVVIVTARDQVQERIKGLNLGADDYVPKPVDTAELIARIRAVVRRRSGRAVPVITCGPLTVKTAEHQAKVSDAVLDLTGKEFAVLEYMAQNSNQVVTRTMLMEHVWGSDFDSFSNVIDVYIKNLRRKIGACTTERLIKTIRGKGYILGDETIT